MEKHRNMFQMTEQDNTSEKILTETDINNFPIKTSSNGHKVVYQIGEKNG